MSDQIRTEFGWFKIVKKGRVNLYCEKITPKSRTDVIIKMNDIVSNVEVGDEIFLTIDDQSFRTPKGTKIVLIPKKIICNSSTISVSQQAEIDDLHFNKAIEYLKLGYCSGAIIDYAIQYLSNSNNISPDVKSQFFLLYIKNHQRKLDKTKVLDETFKNNYYNFKIAIKLHLKKISEVHHKSIKASLKKHYKKIQPLIISARNEKKIQARREAVASVTKTKSETQQAIKDISVDQEHFKRLSNNPINGCLVELKKDKKLARLIYNLYKAMDKGNKIPRCVEDLKFFIKYGVSPSRKGKKNKMRKTIQYVSIPHSQIMISQLFAMNIVSVPNENTVDSKGRKLIKLNLPNKKEVMKIIKEFDMEAKANAINDVNIENNLNETLELCEGQ